VKRRTAIYLSLSLSGRAWFLRMATLGVKVLTKLLSYVEVIEGYTKQYHKLIYCTVYFIIIISCGITECLLKYHFKIAYYNRSVNRSC